MRTHALKLTPAPALALAVREDPASRSARVVSLALDVCPPRLVASALGCSDDLVRRWGRGQGSPSLLQVFGGPERFGRRLLAAAGETYQAAEVCEVNLRERLWLLSVGLGRLLVVARPERIDWHTPEELREIARTAREVAEEADRIARAADRARLAKEQPREEKGGDL